jgi:hypothetical protein
MDLVAGDEVAVEVDCTAHTCWWVLLTLADSRLLIVPVSGGNVPYSSPGRLLTQSLGYADLAECMEVGGPAGRALHDVRGRDRRQRS